MALGSITGMGVKRLAKELDSHKAPPIWDWVQQHELVSLLGDEKDRTKKTRPKNDQWRTSKQSKSAKKHPRVNSNPEAI
jgi:hypothetical protein